jgi:hypothetical protein
MAGRCYFCVPDLVSCETYTPQLQKEDFIMGHFSLSLRM